MDLVIIGNGVAGTTVAIEYRKKDPLAKITIISDEALFHYSRPALMYIYMNQMKLQHTEPYERSFWKKNNITLIQALVQEYLFQEKKLILSKNNQKEVITYDKLVLATGAKGNKYNWPGKDLPQVITFTNLQDLDKIEKLTHKKIIKKNPNFRVSIVGGGLIGIEVAEMMHHRNIPCTFLIREPTYWSNALSKEEGNLICNEINNHHIDLKTNTELSMINQDEHGNVKSITTNNNEEINCNVVVLTAGVSPNIEQYKNTNLKLGKGIMINPFFETNIADVYACGDCAEIQYENTSKTSCELLWYTGKNQAKILAKNLNGEHVSYQRGIWYNSAKFFTIDFHTYGQVNQNLPQENNFFCQIPGENKTLRIVHVNNKVVGFNALGIRLKHQVCEDWILKQLTLQQVLDNLQDAVFDPEFINNYKEIITHVST